MRHPSTIVKSTAAYRDLELCGEARAGHIDVRSTDIRPIKAPALDEL